MKTIKILSLVLLLCALFTACKKNDNAELKDDSEASVSIKNGLVIFNSFADYIKVTENKNNEQLSLFKTLKNTNFLSLSKRAYSSQPANYVANQINSFSNAFDSTLYTDYVLSILNKDKICVIDGFWVKVDMDNNFCSALDQSLYPNEYNDLLNNNQNNNSHIMVFLSQDEPVLECLQKIRSGEINWTEYQDLVAKKGGQGICFKKGADAAYNQRQKSVAGTKLVIYSIACYMTNFLHYELYTEGYANADGIFDNVRLGGKYQWEGSCRNSGSNPQFLFTPNPVYWKHKVSVYSGGSTLSTAKLQTTTFTYNYGAGATASIGY